jgi:hypothetical protein
MAGSEKGRKGRAGMDRIDVSGITARQESLTRTRNEIDRNTLRSRLKDPPARSGVEKRKGSGSIRRV